MARVLVTGANGYIGLATVRALAAHDHEVVAGTRENCPFLKEVPGIEELVYGDLTEIQSFKELLNGIDVVVHTAAIVHKGSGTRADSEAKYRRLNTDVVGRLAADAGAVGVHQIVFLSTIAVHGTRSVGTPVDESSPYSCTSPYAESKRRGEEALQQACEGSTTAWTIIRPAMVYGRDAPGNFSRLVSAVNRRVPLPFGRLENHRSIMSVDDLVDLIVLTIENPKSRNEALVAADISPMSTREIVEAIAIGVGKRRIVWPLSPVILRIAGRLLGLDSTISSLVDDFVVDSNRACNLLDWDRRGDSRSEIIRYLQGRSEGRGRLARNWHD